MKKFLLLSAVFLSIFSSSFAEKVICVIPQPHNNHCIVTDDDVWGAYLHDSGTHKEPFGYCKMISGISKVYPANYVFYFKKYFGKFNTKNPAEYFLRNYALNKSTSFSGVEVKEESEEHCVYTGVFFRLEDSKYREGFFSLYVFRENDNVAGIMFVKIYSLDIEEPDSIFQEAFDLITPLYNPKALTLWLESVEKEREAAGLE